MKSFSKCCGAELTRIGCCTLVCSKCGLNAKAFIPQTSTQTGVKAETTITPRSAASTPAIPSAPDTGCTRTYQCPTPNYAPRFGTHYDHVDLGGCTPGTYSFAVGYYRNGSLSAIGPASTVTITVDGQGHNPILPAIYYWEPAGGDWMTGPNAQGFTFNETTLLVKGPGWTNWGVCCACVCAPPGAWGPCGCDSYLGGTCLAQGSDPGNCWFGPTSNTMTCDTECRLQAPITYEVLLAETLPGANEGDEDKAHFIIKATGDNGVIAKHHVITGVNTTLDANTATNIAVIVTDMFLEDNQVDFENPDCTWAYNVVTTYKWRSVTEPPYDVEITVGVYQPDGYRVALYGPITSQADPAAFNVTTGMSLTQILDLVLGI